MVLFQVIDKFSSDFAKSAFKFEKVKTDNTVFRLHYKLSVWLVVLYSVCYMYVAWSNPISCIGSKSGDNAGVGSYRKEVNDYCWVHGTYILPDLDPAKQIFPGIGQVTGKHVSIRYHHYYKWMYFYIAAMIILLHTPRQFWRSIECGRMSVLVKKLQCIILNRDEDIEKEKESLADYLYCHVGYHRKYAYGFVFAEVLNVIVSLFLMFIWDSITEHEFSMHGAANFAVIQTPPSLRTDRLAKVFPILGKCTFNTHGPGGNIQPNDFICVLPLNLINERAAIFFWYYFMLLLALGICALIFRVALIGSKRLRLNLLSGLTPLTSPEDIEVIMNVCPYSDWFVIYQLGSCVEPVMFREIMKKLVRKLHASKYEDWRIVEA